MFQKFCDDPTEDLTMEDVSGVELPLQICVVGDELFRDREFVQTCSKFGHPVHTSQTGQEFFNDTNVRTIYILPQFSGPVFDKLSDARKPILGPPAVKDLRSCGSIWPSPLPVSTLIFELPCQACWPVRGSKCWS